MTSATSVIEPNVSTMVPSPFMKEEELKSEVEAPGKRTELQLQGGRRN